VADNSPSPEDQEKAFWEKMTGVMDSWWDNKVKQYNDGRPAGSGKPDPPAPTGTSRTGGERVTLTGLIADIVFGPKKD
jgi:hypothetical protein